MTQISTAEVVWQVLDEAARTAPDRQGYLFEGKSITFKDMDQASDRVACGLLNLGVKRGDRIGIIGLNQLEWLYTYFAAAKIGAIVVGLSVRYRDVELDYMINQSEIRAVVSISGLGEMDYVKFFKDYRGKFPSVSEFIFIGAVGFSGSLSLDALLNARVDQASLDQAKAAVRPNDIMMIIYTSRTTGQPKGASLSHKSQLASARAEVEHIKLTEDEMVPIALPLHHVSGITGGIMAGLLAKATIILVPFFDPDAMVKIYMEYEPTIYIGIPTMHELLLMSRHFASWQSKDKIRVVLTGGSNPEPHLLMQLMEAFPDASIMNFYGLSESSGGVVMSPWDSDFDHTVRCIGKTIGGFEAKVVDIHEGTDLPCGETGELCIKGDAVIPGYFRMPEETEAAFQDGWLHTGDLAYIEEDGYLTLMGRLKEMVLQDGNVCPAEAGNVLAEHPKVMVPAGISVSDRVWGEVGRHEPTIEE